MPANLDWVRADLIDYWRLLNDAQIRLDRHYLLCPNPWPKIGHLSRRWHWAACSNVGATGRSTLKSFAWPPKVRRSVRRTAKLDF